MFTNLRYLNFCPSSIWYQSLCFGISPPTVNSSILLELHVCLEDFTDCLYLLDGRFNKLRLLYVEISDILSRHSTINNKEKLPSLEYFSLHCDTNANLCDELIIPLLHRMPNLENLDLSLLVWRKKPLVDGNYLKNNIINSMPRLNKFTFNIRSCSYFDYQIYLPSNENIQKY